MLHRAPHQALARPQWLLRKASSPHRAVPHLARASRYLRHHAAPMPTSDLVMNAQRIRISLAGGVECAVFELDLRDLGQRDALSAAVPDLSIEAQRALEPSLRIVQIVFVRIRRSQGGERTRLAGR